MLRPITQAQSDAWDAQPGTDAFGRPWSSWERVIMTDHQAELLAIQARMMRAEAEAAALRLQRRQKHLEQRAAEHVAAAEPDLQMQLGF